MKKLLIATTNPGKLGELKEFLSDLPIELVSLKDIGITEKPEETGKTFEENAKLKAEFYMKKSGFPTLADDGGFEIDALGGEPGVKSHRWEHSDREATDEEIIAYTMKRMQGIPPEKRGAQLRLVLMLALPSGEFYRSEDKVRGVVAEKPSSRITPGFPYRSLLFIPEIHKFYDQKYMTTEENDQYNHRKHAVEKLKPFLHKWLTS